MHIRLNTLFCKVLLVLGAIMSLHWSEASGKSVSRAELVATTKPNEYYTVNTLRFSDGMAIEEGIINGPPAPPPGFGAERQAVATPVPNSAAGVNILTEVPAFNWVFGCSSVSGAMIAGYYDRTGFPNMYTGPTNGGVMPLNNSSWPTWSDGAQTYPSCPLIASKNGVDGRAIKGSIDDYWVQYNSTAQDPYITGAWTQHAWGDAIGDYMKTSQSAYSNVDGSTSFYTFNSSASQLTCSQMVGYTINDRDGTYGRKLFYEARGYTVTDCYNQKTDNIIAGGFSFAQFKAEIDAGRPVMLNLAGHTVVGVGYDDSSNTVYIHDTWDYSNHTMTWGSYYSTPTMILQSVSIVNIASDKTLTVNISGNGNVNSDPSGIACSTGNSGYCSHPFPNGQSIVLSPTASDDSMFTTWPAGVCTTIGSNNTCHFTLTADKSITATFTILPPVFTGGSYYGSLQDAYNGGAASCTIMAKAVALPALDFTLNSVPAKTITLEGGYDSTYSVNNDYTTLQGKLTLATGSLTLENLIIK